MVISIKLLMEGAVCEALADQKEVLIHSLSVPCVPKSGKPLELLEKFGISASHIVKQVKAWI